MWLLIGDNTRIRMGDDQLDEIARQLEEAAPEGRGVWIEGDLAREVNGAPAAPDPDVGHQRLWLHPSQLVSFIYDRPRGNDPRVTGG